ncbi:hypothetical protein CcaCcLH18_02636 [Colletotrichum camelliae]|nr:hypothetical protein CcaCcLH18_02636 [Colletotrichum camelliae]
MQVDTAAASTEKRPLRAKATPHFSSESIAHRQVSWAHKRTKFSSVPPSACLPAVGVRSSTEQCGLSPPASKSLNGKRLASGGSFVSAFAFDWIFCPKQVPFFTEHDGVPIVDSKKKPAPAASRPPTQANSSQNPFGYTEPVPTPTEDQDQFIELTLSKPAATVETSNDNNFDGKPSEEPPSRAGDRQHAVDTLTDSAPHSTEPHTAPEMTICGNELSEEEYRQAEDAQKGFFDHHRKSSTEFKSMPGTFGGDGMKDMSDGLKEKFGGTKEKSGDAFKTFKVRAKDTSDDAVTTFKAMGREEIKSQKKVARMFKGLLERSSGSKPESDFTATGSALSDCGTRKDQNERNSQRVKKPSSKRGKLSFDFSKLDPPVPTEKKGDDVPTGKKGDDVPRQVQEDKGQKTVDQCQDKCPEKSDPHHAPTPPCESPKE